MIHIYLSLIVLAISIICLGVGLFYANMAISDLEKEKADRS